LSYSGQNFLASAGVRGRFFSTTAFLSAWILASRTAESSAGAWAWAGMEISAKAAHTTRLGSLFIVGDL
jgi:hypothetical protein